MIQQCIHALTHKVYFLLLAIILSVPGQAQQVKQIELLNANTLEFDESLGKNVRRLIGNVSFKHDRITMDCDSAYLFTEQNRMDAFGRIFIKQGDTVTVRSRRLEYNGNTSLAQLFDEVVMSDRKMTLTTDKLDYNLKDNIAYYTSGGKLVDQDNTLTSDKGYYYSATKEVYFKQNVVLVNPRYTMNSDTLRYNTASGIAYFLGPSTLRSNENFIYCEKGWYDTRKETSSFYNNAYLSSRQQKISGDTILYNRQTFTGRVKGNVEMVDTIQKVSIKGNYGEYRELSDWSMVTGKALMILSFDQDSLFLHADTLLAHPDTITGKRILRGYHNVRFFKLDIQGVCDSLVYTFSDSTIRFYKEPVLWSDENQLTADSISIVQGNGSIEKVILTENAFITSKEDTAGYNQIRGKNMVGYFGKNQLEKIDVTGNGQTIYFARNKQQQTIGVNRADCSDMLILISENKVDKITFIKQPDATLFPLNELKAEELFLKGFNWQDSRRPRDRESIFINQTGTLK